MLILSKGHQTIKFKEIMFKIHKEELEVNGKKLTLETGKVARQADGAIIATLGETVVIATAVGAKKLMMVKIIFHYQSTIKKNIMLQEKFLEDILKEKRDPQRQKH